MLVSTFSTDVNLVVLAPALLLLVSAASTLLFALTTSSSRTVGLVALAGVGLALIASLNALTSASPELSSFGGRYSGSVASVGFTIVILLGTALAMLIAYDYLARHQLDYPEYYPLLLLSATGAVVLASAQDIIVLLLGLEIMSLAVYVLAAWRQNARASEEAGMKYFLLGAFASAFLIYGIALMYGASGGFRFVDIAAGLAITHNGLLASVAGVFILTGLGFKVALVPFHQWAPDVYTGAPTAVTAFMSVVVKTAAFAALLQVMQVLLPQLSLLAQVLALLVALTMVVGNFAALAQTRLKRMLAYSAVAHAGYLGMALLAGDASATRAILWYLLAYTLMNIGTFAILTLLTESEETNDSLESFAGLGNTRPYLAAAMSIFMLSLAGIPPLAGFAGKFLVFQVTIEAGYAWLAVLGILTSVIALVYYVRVIQVMYLQPSSHQPLQVHSRATTLAISLAVVGTIVLGILPNLWYGVLNLG